MKKIISFCFLLILSCTFFFACQSTSEQADSRAADHAQSQVKRGNDSTRKNGSSNTKSHADNGHADSIASVDYDHSLLGDSWKVNDLMTNKENLGYLSYYYHLDSNSSTISMSFVSHYDKQEDTLEEDLQQNVDNYLNKTLPTSMATLENTTPTFYTISDYPAAAFEIKGKMNEEADTFVADTTFIAVEKGIYCLQMQSPEKDIAQFNALYKQIKESLQIIYN